MAKKQKLNMQAIEGRRAANTPSGDKNTAIELEKYQNAVTGALDILVPAINIMKEDIIAVTGAIYGKKTINEATKFTQLLGTMNNVDIAQTPLKGLAGGLAALSVNTDKLLSSTNKILKGIPGAVSSPIIEYLRETESNRKNEVKVIDKKIPEKNTEENKVDLTNIEEYLKGVSTILSEDIKNAVIANDQTKLLNDINDVLSIDIKDGLNNTDIIEAINQFKSSNGAYLGELEKLLRTTITKNSNENSNSDLDFLGNIIVDASVSNDKHLNEIIEILHDQNKSNNDEFLGDLIVEASVSNDKRLDSIIENTKAVIDKIEDSDFGSIVDKLDEVSSLLKNTAETAKGEIKLIVEGIDKGTVDSLIKLSETKIDKNNLFSGQIDFEKTLNALREINKFSLFKGLLNSTWIDKTLLNTVDSYNELLTKLAITFTSLCEIQESIWDIGILEESEVQHAIDIIASFSKFGDLKLDWLTKELLGKLELINKFGKVIGDIDTEQLIDGFYNIGTLEYIVNDGFAWLDNPDFEKRINELNTVIEGISKVSSSMTSIAKYAFIIDLLGESIVESMNVIYTFLMGTDKDSPSVHKLLDKRYKWDDTQLKSIITVLDSISSIMGKTGKLGIKSVFAKLAVDKIISFLEIISDNKDGLYKAVNKLPNFKDADKKFVAIRDLFDAIRSVAVTASLLLILYIPAILGIKLTSSFIDAINTAIDSINVAGDPKKLKTSMNALKEFAKLMLVMTGIIFLAAFTGGFLLAHVGEILAFTVILAGFMFLTVGAFNLGSKGIQGALSGASQFAILLLVATGLLFLGALTGMWLASNIINILLFTGILAGFIWAVTWAYTANLKEMKGAMTGAKDFAILLVVSAGILILAGKVLSIGDVISALFFAAVLAGFIYLMTEVYVFALKKLRKSIKALKDFMLLVVGSAAILMVGALFMMIPGMWINAIGFGLLLAGFIWLVTKAYSMNTRGLAESLRAAPAFTLLIVVSAMILMAAAYFMTDPMMFLRAAAFGLLLAGFIWLVTKAYSMNAENIGKAFLPAIGLAILVALSGAVLIWAGTSMSIQQMLGALLFGAILCGFVAVMGLVAKMLGKMWKNVLLGELVMVGLILITALAAWAFGLMADTVNKFGGAGAMLGALAAFAGAVAILATVAGIIGIPAVAAFVAIGEVVIAGLVGIVLMAAIALDKIADAMIKIKQVGGFDPKPIESSISGFMSVVTTLMECGLCNPLTALKLDAAADAMESLATALSKMAKTTQDFASLTIPVYEGNKIVGRTKMSNSDFKNAARNVKTIITTLASAVVEVYDMRPELFEETGGLFGIGSKSKFSIVSQSCEGLGKMLSKIAKSVKDYASLVVPEYTGTKITGYRTLDKSDFKNAAKNVKEIVSTLGGAIIEIYDQKPELFETSGGILGFGAKSKFTDVVNSCTGLGKMLSKIAASVKDYASLVVPEYNGDKITSYRTLTEPDFKDAANNVKTIISVLGDAIIEIYDKKPELFETSGGILGWGAKSKFTNVVNSCTGLGQMLSMIAKSVQDYASMVVPEYTGDKITSYRKLNDTDFTNAAKNVKTIITTLGQAIIDTYNTAPEGMFETTGGIFGFGGETPFARVVTACSGMGNMINQIASAVKDYASLRVPVYDENGKLKEGETRELSEEDFTNASRHISMIITTLGNAMMSTYGEHKNWFEDPSWFGNDLEGSPFGKVLTACTGMGNMISQIANGVKEYAALRIEEWDPVTGEIKAGKYRAMNKEDFKAAGENIGLLISTIGGALMLTFNEHKKWFEDPSWFGSKAERTPFGMLMASTAGMGELISGVAKSVMDVANMKFTDPATGQEIHMGVEEIGKTGVVIGKMFTSIFQPLADVYDKFEDSLFDDDGEIITNEKNYVNLATEVLGSVADCINKVLNLKIGEDIISIKHFNENNEHSVPTIIDKLVSTIPTVISNNSSAILSQSTIIKRLNYVMLLYNYFFSSLTDIWNAVIGLMSDKNQTIVDTYGKPENNLLNKMLTMICSSTVGVKYNSANTLEQKHSALLVYGDIIESIAEIYKEYVPELLDNEVMKNAKALGTNNVLRESVKVVAEMFDGVKFVSPGQNTNAVLSECTGVLHNVIAIYSIANNMIEALGDNISTIQTVLPDLYTPVESFSRSIIESDIDVEDLKPFNKDSIEVVKAVTTLVALAVKINHIDFTKFMTFDEQATKYMQIIGIFLAESLNGVNYRGIQRLNEHYPEIDTAVNNMTHMNNLILTNDFSQLPRFAEIAQQYRDGIVNMAEAYEILDNMSGNVFDNLYTTLFGFDSDEDLFAKALRGINDVMSKISNQTIMRFHRQTEDVAKFTKTINNIDLAKANALTKLTDSLNELAHNMGNLDGLTEAVANKLSGVLEKLTAELNSTKDTFKTAERIQKERYEYISKTIKTVEDTMRNPIMVKVGLDEEEDENKKEETPTTPDTTKKDITNTEVKVADGGKSEGGSGTNSTQRIGGNNGYSGGPKSLPSTPSKPENQYDKNGPEAVTDRGYTYKPDSRVKTVPTKNTFSNLNSNLASTVRSVFEEMIFKYNLEGGGARGNGSQNWR